MKFDRNRELQAQRVDRRKANRPKVVTKVPEHGQDDDVVVVKDEDGISDVLLRVEDEWVSLLPTDDFSLDADPEVQAVPGEPKSVRIRYTIPAGHPRTRPTRFEVAFTDENGETLAGASAPTNVEIVPSVPSKQPGRHFVTIIFTPQRIGRISVDLTLS